MIYPSNFKTTSYPTVEPVSLSEMKEHLRITDTNEDTLIESYIRAATEWAQNYENRAYCFQQITTHYPAFDDKMILPINPVVSIESITYIDDNGTTQTLDSSLYELDNYSCPAFIYPAYNASLPSVRSVINTIEVIYYAGYVSDTSNLDDIPERVKQAIKLVVGHLFEHRLENSEVTLSTIPFAAKNLLTDRVFI